LSYGDLSSFSLERRNGKSPSAWNPYAADVLGSSRTPRRNDHRGLYQQRSTAGRPHS